MEDKSWTFELFGIHFDGTTCMMTALTCFIVFFIVFFCTRNMQLKPKGKQNFIEWVVDFVRDIVGSNIPKNEVNEYHLLGFTLFLFVFIGNLLGLVTKISVHDVSYWKSPTVDPILTLTLAMIVVVLTSFYSVKKFGMKGYFVNSYMKPVAFLLPIKLVEEFTNVMTLGLRLYGNIFAGELLLTLIAGIASKPTHIPLALPLEMIWQGFSLFIGSIQAYVFVTLTMVYMSHKVEAEEE